MIAHVVLGASDPENATLGQREQMLEVDVGLVEHRDLSGRQPGAQGDHAATIVVRTFFDHGKGRQEGLQVQAQVQLAAALRRRCFAQSIQLATNVIVEESIL